MTQNSRFHRLRNQMDISKNKILRKNNFLKRLCFPSAMSWIWKSNKMRFPENSPKMVELHNYIKSSEMVLWGRYMIHFDRRDLLKSKKISLGSIPQHIRTPRADSRIFAIFSEISPNFSCREKPIFLTSNSEKLVEKWFFSNIFEISKNMILELHFDIFTLSVPQIYQKWWVFEI